MNAPIVNPKVKAAQDKAMSMLYGGKNTSGKYTKDYADTDYGTYPEQEVIKLGKEYMKSGGMAPYLNRISKMKSGDERDAEVVRFYNDFVDYLTRSGYTGKLKGRVPLPPVNAVLGRDDDRVFYPSFVVGGEGEAPMLGFIERDGMGTFDAIGPKK